MVILYVIIHYIYLYIFVYYICLYIFRNNGTHTFTSLGKDVITSCIYCYEILCAIPHRQAVTHSNKPNKKTSNNNTTNTTNTNNTNSKKDMITALDNQLITTANTVCVLLIQV